MIGAYTDRGQRFLRTRAPLHNGGSILLDRAISSIFVIGAQFPGETAPMEEAYSRSEEDQNEAFEQIFEELHPDQEVDVESSSADSSETQHISQVIGPKRVEVIFLRIPQPTTKRRAVILSATTPMARFDYSTIMGRPWARHPYTLDRTTIAFSPGTYLIEKIFLYEGGAAGGMTLVNVGTSPESQRTGWARVVAEVNKLHSSELNVVRGWDPEGSPDAPSGATRDPSHWTQRVPSAYTAPEAARVFFRVRGDAIGAEIIRRRLVGEPAPRKEPPPAAHRTQTSEVVVPTGATFCDCGSLHCENCLWTNHAGSVGFIPPGITIH